MKNVINLLIVIGWLGSGLMMLGSAEALASPNGNVFVVLMSVFCFFISSMLVIWLNVRRLGRDGLREMLEEEERDCRDCAAFRPWGKAYTGDKEGKGFKDGKEFNR
ncbi:MAG: hypothetical protein ACK5JU_12480 [Bacteroidales bacterium]